MKADWVPGLSVQLVGNGLGLREYQHDQTDEANDNINNTVSRFVEVVPGTQFGIVFHFNRAFLYHGDDIKYEISLDGRLVGHEFLLNNSIRSRTHHRVEDVTNFVDGAWQSQNLTFSEIKTTEEWNRNDSADEYSGIGKITIRLFALRIIGPADPDPYRNPPPVLHQPVAKEIPEKAFKGRAISTQTSLGDPRPALLPIRVQPVYPYGIEPFVRFEYNYRSRWDLQVEGLIPRSPTPVPLEERDPNDLSPEEARELVRRLQARNRNRTPIKKEKRERSEGLDAGENDRDDGVAFVGENRATKRHRAIPTAEDEIIDLSAD